MCRVNTWEGCGYRWEGVGWPSGRAAGVNNSFSLAFLQHLCMNAKGLSIARLSDLDGNSFLSIEFTSMYLSGECWANNISSHTTTSSHWAAITDAPAQPFKPTRPTCGLLRPNPRRGGPNIGGRFGRAELGSAGGKGMVEGIRDP